MKRGAEIGWCEFGRIFISASWATYSRMAPQSDWWIRRLRRGRSDRRRAYAFAGW